MRADASRPWVQLLVWFSPLLFAATGRAASVPEDDFTARLEFAWPSMLNKGYCPIWISLENKTEADLPVRITVETARTEDGVATRKAIALPARTAVRVELFIPTFVQSSGSWSWGGWNVTVESPNRRQQLPGQFVTRPPLSELRSVLVLAQKQVDDTEEAQWAEDLSHAKIDAHGPWSSSDPVPNVRVSSARVDAHMPSRPEGYSSLDLVALDLGAEVDDEKFEVLMSWVRRGGRLLLFGAEAEEQARALQDVEEWLEERFCLPFDGQRTRAFGAGLGILVLSDAPGPFLADDEHRRAVQAVLRDGTTVAQRPSWVPRGTAFPSYPAMIEIPGLGQMPYGIFLVALLAFAILIGPVNFLLIRRAGRPSLLLLSVPVISLLTSLSLLAYGIFHAGIDTRGTSSSLTLLDQREQRATTVESCTLYAGLSPGEGLRPESGTSVHPVFNGEERRYQVDMTQGVLLSAGYVPVREPFQQVRLSDRGSHVGLELSKAEDGGLRVVNGFPCEVRSLVVSDLFGGLHRAPESLAPGDSLRLEPVPDLKDRTFAPASTLLAAFLGSNEDELLPGSYLAELAEPQFLDDCGIESRELAGSHSVLGLLPQNMEEW